jgi:hypothetical protein
MTDATSPEVAAIQAAAEAAAAVLPVAAATPPQAAAPANPTPAAPQAAYEPPAEAVSRYDDEDHPSRLPVALRPAPAGPDSNRLVRPGEA